MGGVEEEQEEEGDNVEDDMGNVNEREIDTAELLNQNKTAIQCILMKPLFGF